MKNEKKLSTQKVLLVSLVVMSILGFGIFMYFSSDDKIATDETISIPLNELSMSAQFFEEEIDGVPVKFFAMMDDEGDVKTAFDACDVCYRSKKGYRQEGEYMVCNNCGNKYHMSGIGTENKAGGGCWPSYLPSKIEGDELILEKDDLFEGKYKFT